MKIKKTILIMFSLLFVLSACSNDTQVDMESVYGIKGDHGFVMVDNYDDLIFKVADEEPGIYYFASPTCEPCKELTPMVNDALLKNDKKAFYINVESKKFNNDHKTMLMYLGDLEKEDNDLLGGIPALFVIDEVGSVYGSSEIMPQLMKYMKEGSESSKEFIQVRLNSLVNR